MAKVTITKNGPYVVTGSVPLSKETEVVKDNDEPEEWKKVNDYPNQETYSLCRCGNSKTKPFCDGSHVTTNFDGTETASKKSYLEQAKTYEGPNLKLTDAKSFCSVARFCNLKEGTWDAVEKGNKELAIQTACNCPSGRLVLWENNKPIEPKFAKSISLIEDPQKGCSGGIWLKGGIELDGYETRNRMTLCRCGKSGNKPFCDGTHIEVKFKAEK